jgi:hypothetical protein
VKDLKISVVMALSLFATGCQKTALSHDPALGRSEAPSNLDKIYFDVAYEAYVDGQATGDLLFIDGKQSLIAAGQRSWDTFTGGPPMLVSQCDNSPECFGGFSKIAPFKITRNGKDNFSVSGKEYVSQSQKAPGERCSKISTLLNGRVVQVVRFCEGVGVVSIDPGGKERYLVKTMRGLFGPAEQIQRDKAPGH